jgi:predicted nucleic acid-binding protein
VIVVADSSPLIVLAKLLYLDFLSKLYSRLCISTEVHYEVVVAGAGLPGAAEVENANWIEVKPLQNKADLLTAQQRCSLGAGELSTILLGKELGADIVLLDDFDARKLARTEGLQVRGSIGLLEAFYRRGYLADLRAAFRQLLGHNIYVDQRLLDDRLRSLGLPLL